MKTKIVELISYAMESNRFQKAMGARISATEEVSNIADHLIANGVSIIPEGSFILT